MYSIILLNKASSAPVAEQRWSEYFENVVCSKDLTDEDPHQLSWLRRTLSRAMHVDQ